MQTVLSVHGDEVLSSEMRWSQAGSCEQEQPVLLFGRCRIWISADYPQGFWRMLATGMAPQWAYDCFLPNFFKFMFHQSSAVDCIQVVQRKPPDKGWSGHFEAHGQRLDWWRGLVCLDGWQLAECCVLCSSNENSFDLDSVANLTDGAPCIRCPVYDNSDFYTDLTRRNNMYLVRSSHNCTSATYIFPEIHWSLVIQFWRSVFPVTPTPRLELFSWVDNRALIACGDVFCTFLQTAWVQTPLICLHSIQFRSHS